MSARRGSEVQHDDEPAGVGERPLSELVSIYGGPYHGAASGTYAELYQVVLQHLAGGPPSRHGPGPTSISAVEVAMLLQSLATFLTALLRATAEPQQMTPEVVARFVRLAAPLTYGAAVQGAIPVAEGAAERASAVNAHGRLELVPPEMARDRLPLRFVSAVQEVADGLVRLAREIDDPDVRLDEGLRLKERLQAIAANAVGEGMRFRRQLALLMFDAVRRAQPESLTASQVSALQEGADRLVSPDLGPSDLQWLDHALLATGLDALPELPEDD